MAVAITAFLRRFPAMERRASFVIILPLLFLSMTLTSLHDPAVLDTDDPVRQLRNILVMSDSFGINMNLAEQMNRQELKTLLQYSLIVVSSVPVLLLYPLIQKHFVKGIMMGSIKG